MLWNLSISAITAILVLLNIVIFKSLKNPKRRRLKRFALTLGVIFLIPWIVAISPNILLLVSPLTPAVKGRIVDAETRKPLPNIRIKAAWYREHVAPWGAAKARYKNCDITSNSIGEFRIPRTVKTFTLFIPVFVTASYGGIYIFSYDHDFFWRSGIYVIPREIKPADTIEIALRKIKDDKEYLDTINETYSQFTWMQSDSITQKEKLSPEDWNYLVEAHRLFDTTYSKSDLSEKNLLGLSGVLEYMGQNEEAIHIIEDLVKRYPGKHEEFAKNHINYLTRKAQKSKGEIK